MSRLMLLAAACLALAVGPATAAPKPSPKPSKEIRAAIADRSRPPSDSQRDVARHPADLLVFAGVKRGQKIADYVPGGGYFTRMFAKVAGPRGHVYAVFPEFMAKFETMDVETIQALVTEPGYSNVSFATTPNDALKLPEPLDLVWTSDNYHDMQFGLSHDQIVALDKSVFAALKPGGVFLVIDHVAAPGSGWSVASTLHRIDPEAIKADMAQAGFKLEAESDVLRNPSDPHTAVVFDPSIRGRTDQVVLKFRKPK